MKEFLVKRIQFRYYSNSSAESIAKCKKYCPFRKCVYELSNDKNVELAQSSVRNIAQFEEALDFG